MTDKKTDFKNGFKNGVPIMLGYLAVSFAFGMRVCALGVPWWLAGLISFTNLTSAGQFAGTNLMIAGAAFVEIAVATLIINSRYFLMSLSLSQKLDSRCGLFKRLSISYGVTDEIFAVAIGKGGSLSSSYLFGLILGPCIGWTSGALLGGLFSSLLPQIVVGAMGIALYAMFIAIIIPPAKDDRAVLFAVAAAAAISFCFAFIPVFKIFDGGWGIIIITVIVAAAAAFLFPAEEAENE